MDMDTDMDMGATLDGVGLASLGSATAYLRPFRAELVSLLMNLLSDESEAVSGEAKRLLDNVGEVRVLLFS